MFNFMRSIFSEKNLAILLFVMVLITFSLAQEDSRKKGLLHSGITVQQENWRAQDPAKLSASSSKERSDLSADPISEAE
jgi:hypothetical protein